MNVDLGSGYNPQQGDDCSVEVDGQRCNRPAKRVGLCDMHSIRWYRTGSVGPVEPFRMHGDLALRFLSRTEVTDSGCWLWTGLHSANGYGRVGVEGRMTLTHVVAFTEIVGPIPEGMNLDHECHNRDLTCPGGVTCPHRACWNPEHLVPRSNRENHERARTAERRGSRCRKCGGETWYYPPNGYRECRACKKARRS